MASMRTTLLFTLAIRSGSYNIDGSTPQLFLSRNVDYLRRALQGFKNGILSRTVTKPRLSAA